MRDVRIWFEKTGLIRYISHLDLMRTFTRAIRRTDIPLWYTEGFNPHPYLAFALPLSLGMESVNDSLDIRVEGDISNDEIKTALSSAMPKGLTITDVTNPVMKQKEISFGKFIIKFFPVSAEQKEEISNLLNQDEILVQKLSKQGRKKVWKDVNFKEHIQSYEIKNEDDVLQISIVLPAGSSKNINPELLSKKISHDLNLSYSIKRIMLFNAEMKEFK